MLAQYDWQDANRKRSREDEYEDIATGGTLGFTEHRSKRMQALPLRISDASRRWPAPPTLPTGQHNFLGQPAQHTVTPSQSDADDAHAGSYALDNHLQHQQEESFQDGQLAPSPPTFYMEPEVAHGEDMDMMMDTPVPVMVQQHEQQQRSQNCHLQPGSLQPDHIGNPTITGRMPTPIHPSFAAQVRGMKNWGGGAGNIMGTPPPQHIHNNGAGTYNDIHTSQQGPGYQGSGAVFVPTDGSIPRSLDNGMTAASGTAAMTDWSLIQNRRLPSPISENGGEGDGHQCPSGMVMDPTAAYQNYHGRQHGLSSSLPPRSTSAMEMGGSSPAVDVPPRVATPHVIVTGGHGEGDGSMDVEAGTPSPPRKGHSRSKHTVNSWTQQPGMKKSFSIGYRSDCEKCRLKVPGHFNHIIISS